ncbi:MAG: carboxypeptidase regulatory-like domain-containing protein [Vicinamibacterales bacterium]
MKQRRVTSVATVLLAVSIGVGAFAQGASTASITGVVVDSDQQLVPGATVVVRNNGTGETFNTFTSDRGVFSVPSVVTGTYTVTVSLEGFKSFILNNVVVNAGVPASLRATLEIGVLTESIVVQSNSELIQTQTATVSTTLNAREVANLPLSSRSAADLIVGLPGVQTAGGGRDSIIMGLPQGTINMTLDGVNIQDNTLKTTDGFFAIVNPRLDAIEEITFSSAASGADANGMGATQIRYVTRSGTNQFRGSVFHTYRSDELNANNWFNKRDGIPKAELLRNQPGINVGGPIVLPRFNGRNRAFFFVNYEELRQPAATRRTRTILTREAQQGLFRYNTAGGVREVNLFQLAAAAGQTSTPDPIAAQLLADIRNATGKEGTVRDLTDPLFQEYSFQVPTTTLSRYPTVRLDYQITDRHRATYSMNYHYSRGGPDTTNNRDQFFPGFPVVGSQQSDRKAWSTWLRSMFGASLVNELRFGYGGAPIDFSFKDFVPSLWSGSVANQGGFHLNMNNTLSPLTNAGAAGTPSARDAYHRTIENTLNWQKGSHSINMGGLFSQFDYWAKNQQVIPELRFDVVQGDPADGLFVAANFPGASTTNLTNARRLYAILTGRVSEVRGIARLNEANGQYEYLGLGVQRARQTAMGFWLQDAWRMRSNLTLNYGVRYDVQLPFAALNNSYSIGDYADVFGVSGVDNVFKPGTLTGKLPTFRQLTEGERAYPMDWNNLAPSIGFAWTPSVDNGFLSKVTGDTGDLAVRAGYSMSFSRNGLTNFTGQVANNPGVSLNVFRQLQLANLGPLPLLMRDASRLSPAAFPSTPVFPYTEVSNGDITIFSPDLVVPQAETWQAGVTRAIGRTMSVEVRYQGSRSEGGWRTNDYNELNIIENGFLDEFKLAMNNLQANGAAGRGATFAYAGPGTGTSPLPIFLAYFNGVPRDRAGDASLYTSANFRSSTFLTPLARRNPNPYAAVDALDADAASINRAIAAGLPRNFILTNPDLTGGANIVENEERSRYHSMALEFKRRSVSGLAFQTSYVFGNADLTRFFSLRRESPFVRNDGAEGDVTHALKGNLVYELPFGQGKRFGSNASTLVDRVIGGWQVASGVRVQSGQLVNLGNVKLVGTTVKELSKMYKVRIDAQRRVWMLPPEIIDESVKAFSVDPVSATGYGTLGPPSGRYIAPADSFECIETVRGYGDCGLRNVVLTGPMIKQFDIGVAKRVRFVGQASAEFRIDVLNAFNNVNFVPVSGMVNGVTTNNANNRANGANPDDYDVTTLTGAETARVVSLVARFRW